MAFNNKKFRFIKIKEMNRYSLDDSLWNRYFVYRLVFSTNGYEIDFDIKSEITEFNIGLILTFFTGDNVECGGCEFSVKNLINPY